MTKPSSYHHLPVSELQNAATPLYYYDLNLLHRTLDEIRRHTADLPCRVHYAVKANGNPRILKEIASQGWLGTDLVSGGEIQAALDAGFKAGEMTYSGVGKTDREIRLGLTHNIGCFNVESIPELEVINAIAGEMGKVANVAIRTNPDIDAHTHKYITTGTADNKFGIPIEMLDHVVGQAIAMPNIHLKGLHFHIGSQITTMQPYVMLCETANRLMDHFDAMGIHFEMVNVGGGLGIDYEHPDENEIPDFAQYFGVFKRRLKLRDGQLLHFELGRAIVGQCGTLVSHVTYVKENRGKKFVILDAGMSDLIRPALYGARHLVQNMTATPGDNSDLEHYEIVGPMCESSDVFAGDCLLPETRRGDLMAIRSAGAYGESMASCYNMRPLPASMFSE